MLNDEIHHLNSSDTFSQCLVKPLRKATTLNVIIVCEQTLKKLQEWQH